MVQVGASADVPRHFKDVLASILKENMGMSDERRLPGESLPKEDCPGQNGKRQ